jgi:hypothetical protein
VSIETRSGLRTRSICPGIAIERLLASGTVFGACHVALLGQSKMLADNAGVSAEEQRRNGPPT